MPPMPEDDMMEDPSMGGAPDPMAEPMPEDPTMDMGNEEMPEETPTDMGDEGDDSTMSIINQLSDEDKESVRAYAESMLDKKNTDNESNDEEIAEDPMAAPAPQMEGKRFTKKQLKEQFGIRDDEPKTKTGDSKSLKRKKSSTNSPFEPPMFR